LKQKLNEILKFLAEKHIVKIIMLTIITSCFILLTFNSFAIITALYKIVECLDKIAGKYF